MTCTYDIYIWHVVLHIFHDCFPNSREKCIGSPNPLFYRCIVFHYEKQYTRFQTTRTKLAAYEREWRLLTSPIVEKNMCMFYVVVFAVVVVVVAAVDVVEDDAEDDDDDVDDVDEGRGGGGGVRI